MGSVFFGEGGARGFCFFYEPERVGLLELPAEGRSFAFISNIMKKAEPEPVIRTGRERA